MGNGKIVIEQNLPEHSEAILLGKKGEPGIFEALVSEPYSEPEEDLILSERKIWEFNQFTICRLIALAFGWNGLKKIYEKLRIPCQVSLATYSEMHHALVQTCTKPNQVSKYVDTLLRKRFRQYKKRLKGLDANEICQLIESEDKFKDIPLSALVWFALRERHEKIGEIEQRILASLHTRELRIMNFYYSSNILSDKSPEDVEREIRKASEAHRKLQNEKDRSRRKIDNLTSKIQTIEKEKSRLNTDLIQQRQSNEKLRNESENFGGKRASNRIKKLEGEISLLTEEIENLTEELINQGWLSVEANAICSSCAHHEDKEAYPDSESTTGKTIKLSLEGKTVVLVGGKQSLEPHYRLLVENLDGVFYRHDGELSPSTKNEIENLVSKADIALCPVDINSHGAVRCFRNACKMRNKPCCFLRSSSLSMLRKALMDFAEGTEQLQQ